MAYKFQLGAAKLSGSVTQTSGTVDVNAAEVDSLNVNDNLQISQAGAISAATDITGTGDLSMGTITMTGFTVDADGDMTCKSIVIPDDATIGAVGDTDMITLDAGNDVTFASDLNVVVSKAGGFQLADGAVTATAAELNLLDGVTASTAELNFVDGVTSNIQTQLAAKQPLDADLTSLSSCQTGGAAALAALTSTEIGFLDGAGASNNSNAVKAAILAADNSLTIAGGLTVGGDLTYVNTTNLRVTDAKVVFADGATDIAAGQGFYIGKDDGSSDQKASFAVGDAGSTNDAFVSSLNISASAFYGDGSNLTDIAASDAVVSVSDIADNATPQNIGGAGFHLWSGGTNDRVVHLSGTGGWINGEIVYIKNANNAGNKLTIAPSGTDSIDGTNGQIIALETQGAAVTLIRKGTGWQIV